MMGFERLHNQQPKNFIFIANAIGKAHREQHFRR